MGARPLSIEGLGVAAMDLDDAFDALLAEANDSEEEKKRKKKEKKKEKKEKKKEEKKRKREEESRAADEADAASKSKGKMIEIYANDRLGTRVRVKCHQEETIGNVKKLIAAQSGHRADKIRLQKWYNVFKAHVTLGDYEIHDGTSLEMHYN